MKEPLLDKISEGLPKWKTSTVKTLMVLTLSILDKETVCLYKLRGKIGGLFEKSSTLPSSNYRRATRFFTQHCFSCLWIDILYLGFSMLRLKVDYLALDGTSWEHGSQKIHLLTLCVIYKGVAIPIYWEDLRKKGTSNSKERKQLFKRAFRRLNLSGKTLLADREYIGVDWFKYLINNNINFVIRLKKKAYKKDVDRAKGLKYTTLEKKVLRSKKVDKAVAKDFLLEDIPLRIVMVNNKAREDKDAIIYLITNKVDAAYKVAASYFMRWKIESCFKHMKTSGFNLEAINLKSKAKAKLLIAIVVLAYILAVLEGLKVLKKIQSKTYKDGTTTLAVAIFREGIDRIISIANNFSNFCRYLSKKIERAKQAYKCSNAIFVQ